MSSDLHTFKLTATVKLDRRFVQTGAAQQETAEALEIILQERFKQLRGLLLRIEDVKVEP